MMTVPRAQGIGTESRPPVPGSPDNLRGPAAAAVASQRVIKANGGVLVERFVKPGQYGAKLGLRYRIALA